MTPCSPTVVVIEDIHWADEATLDLIKFLARRIQRTSSLLVLTYRDDELGAGHPLRLVLGDLPRAAAHRLPLRPLSGASVFALAKDADQPERARKLFDATNGNPFFVTEAQASQGAGIPATVRAAVLARAARLSPSARTTLEAGAVIGLRELAACQAPSPALNRSDRAYVDECFDVSIMDIASCRKAVQLSP